MLNKIVYNSTGIGLQLTPAANLLLKSKGANPANISRHDTKLFEVLEELGTNASMGDLRVYETTHRYYKIETSDTNEVVATSDVAWIDLSE